MSIHIPLIRIHLLNIKNKHINKIIMRKPERISLSSNPAEPPPKSYKILFHLLSDHRNSHGLAPPSPTLSKKLSGPIPTLDDLLDISPKIQELSKSLFLQFPDLDKFDHKNILSYSDPKLNEKCNYSFSLFEKIIFELNPVAATISGKTIKDDILKIYVICFNYLTTELFNIISEENTLKIEDGKKMLHNLGILINFLILTLQDRKTQALLSQHDVILMQIIREILNTSHEKWATSGKIKDIGLAAQFLCHLFQTVAILAAINESRNFMKTAGQDAIKLSFETFERSLKLSFNHSLLSEIYSFQLTGFENWITMNGQEHIKIAAGYNKKKFSIIQLENKKEPKFTLRYMNLYYTLKILQLLISRKIANLEERGLELVASILKWNGEFLEKKKNDKIENLEIVLNENIVCFNIIKRILPNVDDPFSILDRLGFTRFLKPLMDLHINLALKHKLIVPIIPSKISLQSTESLILENSYKSRKDYIALVLNFLYRLKTNTKDLPSGFRSVKSSHRASKASIGTLVEEIIGDIINGIDLIQAEPYEMRIFKFDITDYLHDSRATMTKQTAEYIIRLVESKTFHFTSPENLNEISLENNDSVEQELENLSGNRIVALLNEIMAAEKMWAENIWQHLMGQIRIYFEKNEAYLFGLYKLIYCALTKKVYTNQQFYKKLLIEDQIVMLNFKGYSEFELREDSKSLRAFNESKGIYDLISIIQLIYRNYPANLAADTKIKRKMTEQLFMNLLQIPCIPEQILKQQPTIVVEFLEFSLKCPEIRDLAFLFAETLLNVIKYNPKNVFEPVDKTNYLPLTILDFIRNNTIDGNEEIVKKIIPLVQLLVNFLIREQGAPSIAPHQTILNNSMSIGFLFQILNSNSNTSSVGTLLCLFLKFLGGIQKYNDLVAAEINASALISKKLLLNFIKDTIKKVFFLII